MILSNIIHFFIVSFVLTQVISEEIEENSVKLKMKWISQIFSEAKDNFDVDPHVSDQCKLGMHLYKRSSENQTIWAVRMMESSEWPTIGLFHGITYHMGNWDECLRAKGPGNLKGQYCLVQTALKFTLEETKKETAAVTGWIDWPKENASVWKAIKMYEKDPVRISRSKYTWALCAPSFCSIDDLKKSLNTTMYPVFKKYGITTSVDIHQLACKVAGDRLLSNSFYYSLGIFAAIVSVVIASTFYELAYNQKSGNLKFINATVEDGEIDRGLVRLFMCFSACQSYQRLTNYSSTSIFIPVNFTKILFMLIIVYGHRLYLNYGFPSFHSEEIEMTYTSSNIQLLETDVVDVFFMITGFLTYYLGIQPMKNGGVVYLIFSLIFRWIRLIPTLGLVMLFWIFILPHTTDGPFWRIFQMKRIDACYQSWWTNLFAVTNIVYPDKPCVPVSWYISVDMQLAVVGSLLLLLMAKCKILGYFVSILVFVVGVFWTYATIYTKRYYGLPRWFMSVLEDPILSEEYFNFYVKTYTRLGPYIFGFLTAALTCELQKKKITFSGVQMIIIGVMSFIIGLGFQFYGLVFFQSGRPYNRVENATYGALHRTLFPFPVAVLAIFYFTSGLGIFNKILHWKVYIPLGRLTFCVLLTSYVIQLYHVLSQRSFLPLIGGMNTIWWTGSDILYSFILAFLLYLISEGPLISISKLLQEILIKKFVQPRQVERTEKQVDSL